jgi:autotransporter-associated beta strand protein
LPDCGIIFQSISKIFLKYTATNDYEGNTTVSAGILAVTGTLGSNRAYAGKINNYDTLVFNQDHDQTLSGGIFGTGGLTKDGTGTLTLSGVNDYSGGTAVSDGTLKGNTLSLRRNISNNGEVVNRRRFNGAFVPVRPGSVR